MKRAIAGLAILIVGVGAGGYAGWNFKPSSAEGLALTALQALSDRRAEEDRLAYETLQARLETLQQAADERAATAARDRARAQQRHDLVARALEAQAYDSIVKAQEFEEAAQSAQGDLDDTRDQLDALLADSDDTDFVEAVEAEKAAADEVINAKTDEIAELKNVVNDQASQIRLKDALIVALNEDSFAKDGQYTALLNRFQAAEDRIEQLNGRRLNFGASAGGGLVKPFGGPWGPGTAAIVSMNLRLW